MSDADVDREKSAFIRRLDETRQATAASLKGIDVERVIYADSGWRVKDLLAHLTAWEREVVTSLNAYSSGGEYRIPNFASDDEQNAQYFRQHQHVPADQVAADWEAARTELKAAIEAVPPERFGGQVMCPWGLYSGIAGIVNDMIGHEADHLRNILATK